MKLRKLQLKDAPLMLEWMHDQSVIEYMQADFASKTLEDCVDFINASKDSSRDLHLAIVDENDDYMGTVSLKNIIGTEAEFAITIRKTAMGKGYSKFGMQEIMNIGFEELKLQSIYWCVSSKNQRAIHFYEKNGYQRIDSTILDIPGLYSDSQIASYIWYQKVREGEI